ncbi:MAG: GTP-binding protein [Candidatus Omnitrophica bacterium]|nr:GTP-binding protein [Candidatus Omnitrophota bacterium]MDD5236932.1 GTP-binding protein [Candidatus Omnitrophota bacterium]MDD5610177.1 GTP-binding protein [Candidatus Omnitrophota bacterium]
MNSQLKFIIVGSVDHGKSTLIGRLLFDTHSISADKVDEMLKTAKKLGRSTAFAYLLDHLEEERRQEVTIDTTQVFFKTDKREYMIIDAPGHVEFVKNMVTGATQAEVAILIIDAEEGIKEQTRRHAYLLSLLGFNQIIVVINKMDLVGFKQDRFLEVQKEADAFLGFLNIKPLFYIPISAAEGDNVVEKSKKMSWYKGKIFLESLEVLKERKSLEDKPLIFPVQDVYRIDDKRIVVGRIAAGSINRDEEIKILPSGQLTKLKSIEKFGQDNVKSSSVGESVGITTCDPVFLDRGDVISSSKYPPHITDTFTADIFWLVKEDFNKTERLTLRCATQEIACEIQSIRERIDSSTLRVIEENADVLKYIEVGRVQIKTKKPIIVECFNDIEELGRFVLVRKENTCAGGIISGLAIS